MCPQFDFHAGRQAPAAAPPAPPGPLPTDDADDAARLRKALANVPAQLPIDAHRADILDTIAATG